MYLQEPTRPSPASRLGSEIDDWIEKYSRLSPVHGDIHAHLHPKRFAAEARRPVCQEAGKLPNHIRSPAHVRRLLRIQVFSRSDLELAAGVRVADIEKSLCHVTFEHHLPAETVLHIGPFNATGRKEVTQRNQDLDRGVERHEIQNQDSFPARR